MHYLLPYLHNKAIKDSMSDALKWLNYDNLFVAQFHLRISPVSGDCMSADKVVVIAQLIIA